MKPLTLSGLVIEKLDAVAHAGLATDALAPMLRNIGIDGPATDDELPEALKGKGLVRGKPVAVWPIGKSVARDRRTFIVDELAVQSLLADGNGHEQPVPFNYEHGDDPIHGGDTSGYMLHFSADSKYIYADKIYWTATAAEKIKTAARGYVSPQAYCQKLDPQTLQVMPDDTESYTFKRPVFWHSAALVSVPALKNLPPASLGAEAEADSPVAETAIAPPSPPARKESLVDHKAICELLGLSPEATTEAQALAALKEHFAATRLAAEKNAEAQKLAADKKTSVETEALAAADRKAQAKEQADLIREELKAQANAEKYDSEILAAEKAGVIVGDKDGIVAARKFWQDAFKSNPVVASQQLAAMRPTGPGENHWSPTNIVGTDQDESLSVDKKPAQERDAILSRATAEALRTGSSFEKAFVAVRNNDPVEAAFHRQVLAADPDWGLPNDKRTGRQGQRWNPSLRAAPQSMRLHPEFDPDKMKHVAKLMANGTFDQFYGSTPSEGRSMREKMLESQKLAGEGGMFAPPGMFPVPGMGFGVFQGSYGGSLIAPESYGGPNERGYYPIYGNNQLRVKVGASGLPEPIARNAEDKPSSTRGYDFKEVIMHGYGNIQWVDRRDQRAGNAVLPIGVMAMAASDSLAYGRNEKELIQSAFCRDSANYNAANVKDISGGSRAWDQSGSTPIQDYKGIRMLIWRAGGGAFPSVTLMGPDVIETLSFHPQILAASRTAGLGHLDRPSLGAYVPLEFLVGIFGSIVVPTCRLSTALDGSNALSPWGQDVIMAVTSPGEIIAPRAFVTIVSSGYPLVRTMQDEKRGLIGSDGADYADMYMVDVAGPTSTPTTNAYLLKNVVPALTIAP